MLKWILRLLLEQRGEVPAGTAEPDPLPSEAGSGDSPPTPLVGTGSEPSATEGEGTPPAKEESFIDPKDLPEELKPHWRRMHSAYNKRLQEIREVKDKATTVDKFWDDESYARQVIAARANQLGMTFQKAPGDDPKTPAAAPGTMRVPEQLVKLYETQLGPGNEEMAKAMAIAQFAGMQMALRPLYEKSKKDEETKVQEESSRAKEEYEKHAATLSENHPGWEENENELVALLDYLQSSKQDHPEFGPKLHLLNNLFMSINGNNGPAVATAVKRINDAAKNRTVAGQPGGGIVVNIDEKVRNAPTFHEAFQIAANAAMEELRRMGKSVPA